MVPAFLILGSVSDCPLSTSSVLSSSFLDRTFTISSPLIAKKHGAEGNIDTSFTLSVVDVSDILCVRTVDLEELFF